MSLDRFLRICDEKGFEPIVGINMFQGYKFDRLEDSIAKAVRLVETCKTHPAQVTYFYLDNEAGHQPQKGNHIPVPDYIDLIQVYSDAIKQVNPDAKIVVNTIGWKGVKDMITNNSKAIDLIDYHWYYNNEKWGRFSVNEWREEVGHAEFERRMREFRKWRKASGNPYLKLGMLEWNLGPANGSGDSDRGTPFRQALVQADMLMSFVEQDVSIASCWPLTWRRATDPKGGFLDFSDPVTGELSPSKHIFKWFAMAGGGSLLQLEEGIPGDVRVLAVRDAASKQILVYLLNKSEQQRTVRITLPAVPLEADAQSFQTVESSGEAVVNPVSVDIRGQTISVQVADTSMTFLKVSVK